MGKDLAVRKRFGAKDKAQIILRLLGEDLELVNRL